MQVGEEYILRGQTSTLAKVTINGEGIPLDAQGRFTQKLLVQKGLLAIEVVAISRFGKQTKEMLTLVGAPPAN
jgi:hypothetical protein